MPHIFSIGRGIPEHSMAQQELAPYLAKKLVLEDEEAWLLEKIFRNSSIDRRYSVLPDILLAEKGRSPLGMSARNAIYKQQAPKLAETAARDAIAGWGRTMGEITHIISVSCTGAITPGLEFKLHKALGMDPYVGRLGINFMGCFGGFKGLSVAHKIALADPKNRVLLVCTELCTLHFHTTDSVESIVIHSLFADGSSACIVGATPRAGEVSLFEMIGESSCVLSDSEKEMTWDASDLGFDMTLSARVPGLIEGSIKPFVERLKGDAPLSSIDWAIHPGGKAIVDSVEKALSLPSGDAKSSWNILKQYGNLSSATILFVLGDIVKRRTAAKYTVGLGFGPGLSIEGILLKNMCHRG